jgi:hypothetical protein
VLVSDSEDTPEGMSDLFAVVQVRTGQVLGAVWQGYDPLLCFEDLHFDHKLVQLPTSGLHPGWSLYSD